MVEDGDKISFVQMGTDGQSARHMGGEPFVDLVLKMVTPPEAS